MFFRDRDRRRYLELLAEYSQRHGLEVVAYCLMTNHLHLVVVPRSSYSLAATLKPVHLRYAQHVNWTRGLRGRLWQGRFYSCPLDDRHALAAVRYVERNPVRARLVRKAESYAWSSAAAHAGLCRDPLLGRKPPGAKEIRDWSAWLRKREDTTDTELLRRCTRTGRPLGDERFVDRLERLSGRALRPRRPGRRRGTPRTV